MFELLSLDETRRIVHERYKRRSHWMVIVADMAGTYLLRAIEERFYNPKTSAANGFDLLTIFVAGGFASVAMLDRGRMPAHKLEAIVGKLTGADRANGLFVLGDPASTSAEYAAALSRAVLDELGLTVKSTGPGAN